MDTAQINTSDDMSWAKAHGLVQTLVIKEIVALENKPNGMTKSMKKKTTRTQKRQRYSAVKQ